MRAKQRVQPPQTQSRTQQISLVRDDDYRELYSNNIKIGFSPLDLFLVFGLLDTMPDASMVVRDQVAIRVSPIQYKVLCETMSIHLHLWEEYFGEIKLPPY